MPAVCVRFGDSDRILLVKVCRSRREDLSSFVRRAVLAELARLNYLPDSQKKALGVAEPGSNPGDRP